MFTALLMVIDTSALISILLGETTASRLIHALVADPKRLISSFTVLETAVVLDARKGPAGVREFDLLLHEAAMEEVAVDPEQVSIARQAYRRFGKGRHPAGLNLGDCCAYALAIHSGEPLLFIGQDFGATDVKVAFV